MKNIKHILWDWNGTLLNDAPFCLEIINGFLEKSGKNHISIEQYRNIYQFPIRKYYEEIGISKTEAEFYEIGADFIKYYEAGKNKCSIFNDAVVSISKLKSAGYKNSVLSAYTQDRLENMLKQFSLFEFMDYVTGVNNIYGEGKIETGINFIKKTGISCDETILVGDSVHDFEVASAMGIKAVLIARGHQSETKLKETGSKIYLSIEEFTEEIINGL